MMSGSGDIGEGYVNEVRHYLCPSDCCYRHWFNRIGTPFTSGWSGASVDSAIGAFLATIVALEGLRSRRIEVRVASALGSDVTHSFAVIGVCSAVVLVTLTQHRQ